jgi:uncharacterized membrane protein YraQ (UPF0718 family)
MTTLSRYLPPIDTNRRAFGVLAVLAVVWLLLYTNLQRFADWLTYSLLPLGRDSRLGHALNFFAYDVPKILLLLTGMIFMISLLQTFIDTQKVRAAVETRGEGIGNLMASLFGAVTPFCSCSSVPLFIGFVEAGIPLGITFSFLITSPIVNEVALVMLLGLFGWRVALLYLVSGVLIGVLAGMVLGRLKLERYVEEFVYQVRSQPTASFAEENRTWLDRLEEAADKTGEIVGKVWLFVIVGIAIGAAIHGFVPEDALVSIMGEAAWWSVPVSVLLGVPLYANAAGVIPIVNALLGKGAALGTALAFMMSVVALSLPELIILRKVLKPRLLVIFTGVVATSILMTGYLFNLII